MTYHIWCNYVTGVNIQLFYNDNHSVMWIKLSWCRSCRNKLWNQLVIWQSYLVQKLVPEDGQLVHHGVTLGFLLCLQFKLSNRTQRLMTLLSCLHVTSERNNTCFAPYWVLCRTLCTMMFQKYWVKFKKLSSGWRLWK